MVRRAFDFLTKLILTLALFVAALPVSASAPLCAENAPSSLQRKGPETQTEPPCAMACCVGKARPMAHCATPKPITAVKPRTSVAPAGCSCEIAPGPALPATPAKAASLPIPAFVWNEDRPLRAVASVDPALLREPAPFGSDAEPPPDPPDRSSASRAPPVVRA